MAAPNHYVRHYDSPLLDELHNHFPELLYGPLEQFQTVQDVLRYMRSQVQNRFNLYNAGYRMHNPPIYSQSPARPYSTAPSTVPPGPTVPPSIFASSPPIRIRTSIRTASETPPVRSASAAAFQTTADLLSLLMSPSLGLPIPFQSDMNFFDIFPPTPTADSINQLGSPLEPVVIRPTPAQINTATAIEVVDAEDDVCAICQDTMELGSNARALNACDHRFHVGCIDTWFQRNVHCPICRHDIREPANRPPAPTPEERDDSMFDM
jgi:hypothetical protein